MTEPVLNAHVERKKSKCDYLLSACPTDEQVAAAMIRLAKSGKTGTFIIDSQDILKVW